MNNYRRNVLPRSRCMLGLLGVAVLLATLTGGVAPAGAATYPDPGFVSGNIRVHDPSVVRRPDGTYVVVSTGVGLEIRTSPDRVNFSFAGRAFPNGASWTDPYTRTSNGSLWAPDISLHNGVYWMYYAASTFGSNRSAIFLATSPTAAPGSWTNQGLVYQTTTSSDHNAIDPNLLVDEQGRWWLTFGSFWTGIKMVRIDAATGKRLAADPTLSSLARRTSASGSVEAPFLYRHGGFYYLFVSFDFCCRGVDSTYRIMVGRSSGITGPYADRNGTPMMSGGATEILATHGRFIGTGHQAVIRDVDGDLLVYHYYDGNDGGRSKLGVNLLGWDSAGWPQVR